MTTTPRHTPRVVAHLIRPRSYCSDQSCGGTDCTTCYGVNAEVLFDVCIIGGARDVWLDSQLLAELDDAPDERVVVDGVTAGDVRCALREALDPPAPAPWKPAPDDAPFIDDDLPF